MPKGVCFCPLAWGFGRRVIRKSGPTAGASNLARRASNLGRIYHLVCFRVPPRDAMSATNQVEKRRTKGAHRPKMISEGVDRRTGPDRDASWPSFASSQHACSSAGVSTLKACPPVGQTIQSRAQCFRHGSELIDTAGGWRRKIVASHKACRFESTHTRSQDICADRREGMS